MCQYCVTDRDGYVKPLEKTKGSATVFITMKNGQMAIVSSGNNRFVESYIDFCPKCGRKFNNNKTRKVKCIANNHNNANFNVGDEYEYDQKIGVRCAFGNMWAHFGDWDRPAPDAKEFDFGMCRFEVID